MAAFYRRAKPVYIKEVAPVVAAKAAQGRWLKMKQTNKKKPTPLLGLLAAVLIVVVAAAPLLIFALQDNVLLAAPQPRQSEAVTGRGVSPEDIYMVRALRTYAETGYVENAVTTMTLSQTSKEEKGVLLPRMQNYVADMYLAGLISTEIHDYLQNIIFVRDEVNFSHWIATNGFEGITCNFGMGVAPPFYIYFQIEMKTDRIFHAEFYLPPEAPRLNTDDMQTYLENTLKFIGLESVKDWEYMTPEEYYEEDYWYNGYADENAVHEESIAVSAQTLLRGYYRYNYDAASSFNAISIGVESMHLYDEAWLEEQGWGQIDGPSSVVEEEPA